MRYFLDTEFLEGTQKKWFWQTKPTIDLISIGIVAEDGREYYAISKDFNLKEAWNRYDIKSMSGKGGIGENTHDKVYWIRDNVLKPIFIELRAKEVEEYNVAQKRNVILDFPTYKFDYKSFKKLINKYGKTNKQIAEEIIKFVTPIQNMNKIIPEHMQFAEQFKINYSEPQFYGYYADYDWVAFCWLFGKMIDLPKGFPMYCIDLKQTIDYFENNIKKRKKNNSINSSNIWNKIDRYEQHPNYPKQTNEHNALADAIFCRDLHKFLNNLI